MGMSFSGLPVPSGLSRAMEVSYIMPSNYAHRIYGDAVYSALSPSLMQRIEPYMPLFQLGLHGSDLLFYYQPFRKTPLGRMGSGLHHFSGRAVIGCLLEAVDDLPEEQQDAGMAYVLGFVCHYLLDSACRPYVDRLEAAGKANHLAIEGEFDLWLIVEEGGTPFTTDPVSHLTGLLPEDFEILAAAVLSRRTLEGASRAYRLGSQMDGDCQSLLLISPSVETGCCRCRSDAQRHLREAEGRALS